MSKKPKTNKISFREAVHLSFRGYRLWYKKYPMMICSSAACAVVEALTPYVGIYLSAQIINEIAGSRDAVTLTRLVLAALTSAAAIGLFNAGLSRWRNYEHAGQWHKRTTFYTEKLRAMDFCDVDSPRTHKLIAQIKKNENFGWGFVLLMGGFDSLISSMSTIIGAVALSFSLFTFNVPESAGGVTVLNNPLFIIPIIAIMLAVTIIVPMLSNKANSYWANFAEDVEMCIKYESFFGKTAQNRIRALDILIFTKVLAHDIIVK
jgi:ATP-binding cassette subfamily B protein